MKPTLKKPTITADDAIRFAEGDPKPPESHSKAKAGHTIADTEKTLSASPETGKSGLVPGGDVRLSANIDRSIHLKLKIAAAEQRTTIGELIEQLVTDHLE